MKCYKIEILEAHVEAVLWVKLILKGDQVLVLAVCYIPQEPKRHYNYWLRTGSNVWQARSHSDVW